MNTMVNLRPWCFNAPAPAHGLIAVFAVHLWQCRYGGEGHVEGDILAQTDISILILAAGSSSRMRGADKLLEPVAGQPLLRHVAGVALGMGLAVTVTLPVQRPARRAVLAGLSLRVIEVAGDEGMAASLRAGVASLPLDHAILMLLADMPEVDGADLATLISAHNIAPRRIHRACDAAGKPGHPVIFPPWLRANLLALQGDSGARAVLAAHQDKVDAVHLPGLHATTDLDTPEDWAAWRSLQP